MSDTKRPRLDNPEEYALIKSIHFKNDKPFNDDIDPIERLERQESKLRNQNKSSR